MPTEGATHISGLDPTRPLDTEVIGESNDHDQMIKLCLKNNFADQTGDAWDIALTVGPRQVNGWEARIAANEAAIPTKANITDAAVKTHFNDNGDTAEVKHAGVTVIQTAVAAVDVAGNRFTLKEGTNAQANLQVLNSVGGVQIEANQTDGWGRIKQLSAAGAEEDTWISMSRNAGVQLFYNNLQAMATTSAQGISVQGDVVINSAAPTSDNHAARKDYVDGKVNGLQPQLDSLQTQINNIINGTTAFTGVVNAPDFNATG